MNKTVKTRVKGDPPSDSLFERVVTILEQARDNAVRSVNSNMVVAYAGCVPEIGRPLGDQLQKDQKSFHKRNFRR